MLKRAPAALAMMALMYSGRQDLNKLFTVGDLDALEEGMRSQFLEGILTRAYSQHGPVFLGMQLSFTTD